MGALIRRAQLCALIILLAGCPQRVQAAKYAGEFLRLGLGARAWGIGDAYVSLASDATAVYWNPANLAAVTKRDVMLMHSETFGSLLNFDAAAFGLPSSRSESPMAVGFALFRLGGGGIQRTALANSGQPLSDSNRVIPTGATENHADWVLYTGVGRRVGTRFDLGASLKVIYRDLVDVTAVGFGLDLGAAYSPHADWRAALVVYDITTTLLAYDNGTKESVNPRAALGLSFTPGWRKFALTLTADGVMEFEGRSDAAQISRGAVSLDLNWGAEIVYRGAIALRGGMSADSPTLGVGVLFGRFRVDGAWRGHDVLDDSYRISIAHSW